MIPKLQQVIASTPVLLNFAFELMWFMITQCDFLMHSGEVNRSDFWTDMSEIKDYLFSLPYLELWKKSIKMRTNMPGIGSAVFKIELTNLNQNFLLHFGDFVR